MKIKKTLCVLLSCGIAAGSLIGCRGREGDQSGDSAANATKSQFSVSLYNGGVGREWLDKTIKAFEEKYADREFESGKKEEAKSDIAPLGRYVCTPDIFDIIRNLKTGANGEYQFTDALDEEAHKNGALAYVFKGTRYDMGDRLGYLKANIEYGLRDGELGENLKEYLKEIVSEF